MVVAVVLLPLAPLLEEMVVLVVEVVLPLTIALITLVVLEQLIKDMMEAVVEVFQELVLVEGVVVVQALLGKMCSQMMVEQVVLEYLPQ
jgi:hypothetical protein